jgi:hypothetical protein
MSTIQMADQRYIRMLQQSLAQEHGGALMGGAYSGGCAPRKPRRSPWAGLTEEEHNARVAKTRITKARRKLERDGLAGQGFRRGGGTAIDRENYLSNIAGDLEVEWDQWEAEYNSLFAEVGVDIIPISQREKTCIRKAMRDRLVSQRAPYITGKVRV